MWCKVEHPIGRRLILPLPGLEQVALHRNTAGTAHALRPLHRAGETEYLVAPCRQDPYQLHPNESGGAGDKRGRPRVQCHMSSLAGRRTAGHPQLPHKARTTPVQQQ